MISLHLIFIRSTCEVRSSLHMDVCVAPRSTGTINIMRTRSIVCSNAFNRQTHNMPVLSLTTAWLLSYTKVHARAPRQESRSSIFMLFCSQSFSDVFPHLVTATNVPKLVKIEDVDYSAVDAIFCCLPHATTQEVINKLPKHLKIVDLSADFRLKNPATYAEW